MTFAQWFALDFWNNVTVLVIIVLVVGMQIGSALERSIKR